MNKCLSLEHALYLGRKWAGESAPRNLIIHLGPRVARSANGCHTGGIQQPRCIAVGSLSACPKSHSLVYWNFIYFLFLFQRCSPTCTGCKGWWGPGLGGLEFSLLSAHCCHPSQQATNSISGLSPSLLPCVFSSFSHPWVALTPHSLLKFSSASRLLHELSISINSDSLTCPLLQRDRGRKGGSWMRGGEREEGGQNT